MQASERACDARRVVKSMNDVQCELSVLQSCLSVCKVTHLLRAFGSSTDASALRAHDDQLKHSINDLLGCQISDTASIQVACGVRNGGLGLRRAQDLALPAIIASRTDAKAGVFVLIDELFSDDIDDLLTSTFDRGGY